jgi:hypothetical protein
MRIRRLVPALVLFLLLSGQVVFLPGEARAWGCCNYCECNWNCSCYSSSCQMAGPCRSASSDTYEGQSISQGLGIRSSQESVSMTVTKPEVIEKLMDLAKGGKCARDKYILNLLGSAGNNLKFQPIRFDGKNVHGLAVALKVTADDEGK